MKKYISVIILTLCIIAGSMTSTALEAEEVPTSGNCGDGVTWSYTPDLDENGTDQGGR